jgi:hypothetical protein
VLFFSRCKPWEIDVQKVAIDNRCVFFGWVVRRQGAAYLASDPASFIVSPACDRDEWETQCAWQGKKPQHTQNRNLVAAVGAGSIAMVPRPIDGMIYCGRVSGPFRISYDQARYRAAAEVFERHGHPDGEATWLSGELAQGWDVDEFVDLPVPMVPAPIRRSLFGRSTYGVIQPIPGERDDPLRTIADLMDRRKRGLGFEPRPWSRDPSEVRQRLVSTVTPNLFEALVVALLQLEEPELAWLGVGGSGDGGVDGIATDAKGDVVRLLQCKWHYSGEIVFSHAAVWSPKKESVRKYLAHMTGSAASAQGVDKALDLDWLTDALIRHSANVPFARTLRVGKPPP